MTQGYILKIPNNRKTLFEESVENDGKFAEPVSGFTCSRNSPNIVFISTREDFITHLALGIGGVYAGTGLRRLNLTDIHPLQRTLGFSELLDNIALNVRRYVKNSLDNGGVLPPQSFISVINAIHIISPEVDPLLARFSTTRQSIISDLSEETSKSLASQKEAISTALQLADIDRKPLLEWTPNQDSTTSFLDGLPSTYTREDAMIINDMHNFPGFELIRSSLTGHAHFENENTKLDIILANRTRLEEQTGTDLIYYNATYKSFVMVQYKAMEEETGGPVYRLSNSQLTEEIARMDEVLRHMEGSVSMQNRNEYRFNTNPFFIKLCRRIILNPDDIDLTPGMYFTLDHWKLLETDSDLIGSGGGHKITYNNVGRRITNTDFANLVRNAWIGTTPNQSTILESLIREILASGKAITFAIKSNKILDDSSEIPED